MDAVVTAVLGILALYLFGGLKVLREYERAVYFFLGRSWGAKGPGLIYVPPLFAKTQQVSLRVVALDIPPQDVITRDNISIKVNAVLYMRVKEPVKAVIGVENYLYATSQLAQTTLRSVLGETELDELLMSREKINNILKNIIDKRAEDWGIEVSAVEVKDVDLPPEMKRAIARQAEAERERRAKVINAEGELQASEKLAQAAHIIGSEPAAIHPRYPSGPRVTPSRPSLRRQRPRPNDGGRAHPPGSARAHHPARGGAAGRRAGHRRGAHRTRIARARPGRRDPVALPAAGTARRADASAGRGTRRRAGMAGGPRTALRSARGRGRARRDRSRARHLDAGGGAAPGEAPIRRPHHLGAEGRRVRVDSAGARSGRSAVRSGASDGSGWPGDSARERLLPRPAGRGRAQRPQATLGRRDDAPRLRDRGERRPLVDGAARAVPVPAAPDPRSGGRCDPS